jgi:hypothetical protein
MCNSYLNTKTMYSNSSDYRKIQGKQGEKITRLGWPIGSVKIKPMHDKMITKNIIR